MRCTACGSVVKPVVALDIDGTLGDYHTHLVQFAEGYLGVELPYGWSGRPENWEEYLGIDHHTYREVKLAFRQGGMKRTMPMFDGARSLSYDLRDAGAEVWITTTRPYNRLDSVDPDTREWLDRNGIVFDHLLYDDNKYQRLAELVDPQRVIMVLEDLPEQCRIAQELFGWASVVMRCAQHNHYEQYTWNQVNNLAMARSEGIVRIKEWYEQP